MSAALYRELIGKRFGRLVIDAISKAAGEHARAHCKCDCGNRSEARLAHIKSGATKSCGCGQANTTHGMSGSPEYMSWLSMVSRCTNPKDASFHRYGGRGIKVCQEWVDNFSAFYSHIGDRPTGHTLDRIDNNKDYEPGNVRWSTIHQQNRNTRRNLYIEYDGQRLVVADWAKKLGIPQATILYRLRNNKPISDVLSPAPLHGVRTRRSA